MQFRVLGSLEVRRGDATVPVGSPRQRTLLAVLLAEAGKVVSVDTLADALWGDAQPADPRNAIQTYVARLREKLGDDAPVVTRAPGYALEVEAEQVDALRFEALLGQSRRRRDEPAVVRDLLDEALSLWRGPAYAEFPDGVPRTEALRLAEQRLAAVEERAAARLALGEAADLVGELDAAVAEEPLRERLVGLLMEALAVVGRQPQALEAYRRYRDRLADETGLDPSPALRDLESRILRGELAGTVPATAVSRAPPAASAVPATPTSLVGRDADIADIRQLLGRRRVVTLTGSGGVGKTRLATEVARAVESDGGEVAWVDLAPVTDPAAVEHVVAAALRVDLVGQQPPLDALLSALEARAVLVVLDNCEHLLAAVAPLVEQVERRCPPVRMLATSRERLAVDGEWVRAVAPLAVPVDDTSADGGDAVRLFLERAEAAGGRPDRPEALPVVAAICRQLDGLPLAIELAAARTGALGLEDLRAALDTDAAAAGQRRGDTARHRDLWAVADWSYRLLDEDEQRLFERLGVFAGAFAVEEAHAVCAEEGHSRAVTVHLLAGLAERSLLTVEGSGRYRMLRPLRAFARQRLADRGALSAVADRHAAVLTARAEQAAGPPLTDEGRRWLEAALDDLREARHRAQLTGDAALLGRLVAALYRFDYWRPGGELIGWADAALDVDGIDDEPTAPQVYAAAAAAAWRRGDLDRARALAVRGTELGTGPDDPARAFALEALGDTASFAGRLADAEAAFRESARVARFGGDPDSEVLGLASAGLVLAYAGRVAEGTAVADAAADLAPQAGPGARAFARYAQGECRAETAPDEAVVLVEEAAVLARDCGAWFVEGVARVTAASVRGRQGDRAAALRAFGEEIRRWRRSGNWTQQWTTLRNLADLLVALDADEPAVAIAAAAESSAGPTFGPESDRLGRALTTARARLGDDAYEAARSRGRRLSGPDAVDLALAAIDASEDRAAR